LLAGPAAWLWQPSDCCGPALVLETMPIAERQSLAGHWPWDQAARAAAWGFGRRLLDLQASLQQAAGNKIQKQ